MNVDIAVFIAIWCTASKRAAASFISEDRKDILNIYHIISTTISIAVTNATHRSAQMCFIAIQYHITACCYIKIANLNIGQRRS